MDLNLYLNVNVTLRRGTDNLVILMYMGLRLCYQRHRKTFNILPIISTRINFLRMMFYSLPSVETLGNLDITCFQSYIKSVPSRPVVSAHGSAAEGLLAV